MLKVPFRKFVKATKIDIFVHVLIIKKKCKYDYSMFMGLNLKKKTSPNIARMDDIHAFSSVGPRLKTGYGE
jgi:hypothetical protein